MHSSMVVKRRDATPQPVSQRSGIPNLNLASIFNGRESMQNQRMPMTSGEKVLHGLTPNRTALKYQLGHDDEKPTVQVLSNAVMVFDKAKVYKLMI